MNTSAWASRLGRSGRALLGFRWRGLGCGHGLDRELARRGRLDVLGHLDGHLVEQRPVLLHLRLLAQALDEAVDRRFALLAPQLVLDGPARLLERARELLALACELDDVEALLAL